MIPKVLFCPKCKNIIRVPKIAGQIQTVNGITIECGQKGCKGKVKIKTEKQEA